MKILFLTANMQGYVSLNFYYWLEELKKHVDVVTYGRDYPNFVDDRPIHDVIREFYGTDRPDYIVQYTETVGSWSGNFRKMEEITDIPKVMIYTDTHNYPESRSSWINAWKFDLVLMPVMSEKHQPVYEKLLKCPIKLFPQSLEPTLFYDYMMPKTYDVVFAGIDIPTFYPLRHKMLVRMEELKREGKITFHSPPHPWYNRKTEAEYEELYQKKGCLWKDRYAKFLNSGKMCLFDGGMYNVAISRYMECMATKCLVLAPMPFNGKALGYVDGENMVAVGEHDFEEKMLFYLHDDAERKRITENAYELVQRKHLNNTRVLEFIGLLSEIHK